MTAKKAVLGRGLDALIQRSGPVETGDAAIDRRISAMDERARVGRVADVRVDAVAPNPYQPRQHFDEAALQELAESIRHLGVIQPLTLRLKDDGGYELITGERRLRAARIAGLDSVPAYVREADTEAMLEMAIVENIQREELDPIEIALGYQRLIDECDLTQETVAGRVGKNRATVTNFLRLLKLPPEVQAALRSAAVSVGHARALLSVGDRETQVALLREIEAEQLSVRQVEERVRAFVRGTKKPGPKKPSLPAPLTDRDSLQVRTMSDRLRDRLSTQVTIRHQPSDGAGRIEIAYYSEDDLERLIELIES